MSKPIAGKIALVTGGSRGLGPYIARALAQEGVHVAVTARTEDALRSLAEELAGFNVRSLAVATDLTDAASREIMVEQVKLGLGPIDILVNNAGVERVSRYVDLSQGFIQSMIETNLMAPMILTRQVLPDMLSRGQGHIVTMSSLGGKKGSPYSATYAATKAGLIEWTAGLREELRQTGVCASVICPGFVAEAGMFAVYDLQAPKLVGETTPQKVAGAVVHAIKEDVGEIIVTPGPVRPLRILDAISPSAVTWILRRFGIYDFYRMRAERNLERSAMGN
jgi:short-subunit dehydrogenase